MTNTVFCSQFSPRNTGNRFLGLWNFPKNFWGARPQTHPPQTHPPPPPLEEGDQRPLVDTVGYSIQTCYFNIIIETPVRGTLSFVYLIQGAHLFWGVLNTVCTLAQKDLLHETLSVVENWIGLS